MTWKTSRLKKKESRTLRNAGRNSAVANLLLSLVFKQKNRSWSVRVFFPYIPRCSNCLKLHLPFSSPKVFTCTKLFSFFLVFDSFGFSVSKEEKCPKSVLGVWSHSFNPSSKSLQHHFPMYKYIYIYIYMCVYIYICIPMSTFHQRDIQRNIYLAHSSCLPCSTTSRTSTYGI